MPEGSGIRLVDLGAGDYGLPDPGYVFDTGTPEKSTDKVRAWALEMLAKRKACADPFRPICPIYVIGPGQSEILDEVAAVLPPGVEFLLKGGRRVFPPLGFGRDVATASIFCLIAR